jgi:hypothetical protein
LTIVKLTVRIKAMEKRDTNLNLRIPKRLWDDLDAYCSEHEVSKTELVEWGISLLIYGARLPEVKGGESNEEVESLLNALDILISEVGAIEGKYYRSIQLLDEFEYRLAETKKAVNALREDAMR